MRPPQRLKTNALSGVNIFQRDVESPGSGSCWVALDLDGPKAPASDPLADLLRQNAKRLVVATDCLNRDREELLAFYDFPAKHWSHLRTTNVIESAFATIRHRSSRAKDCVTRTTMLSMIFKMGMSAERSWKRLRGFPQLGKVFEGVRVKDGEEIINESSREAA